MRIPLRFTITRQELYALVWTKPLAKAAAELGITKAGLGHLCGMNKVPRPSSLFWRHKAIGKPEEPMPLPNPEKNPDIVIQPGLIHVSDPVLCKEAAQEILRIASSNFFQVESDLRGCHPLVSRSHHLLLSSQWDHKGMVRSFDGCLDISVAKVNIRRSILLMDAILKGFKSLGYRVGIADEGRGGTFVEAMGVRVCFAIREYWAIKELPTKNADPLAGHFGIPKQRREIDLVPNSRLRIDLNGSQTAVDGWYSHLETQVSETKATPMERRLKQVAIAVVNLVVRAKEEQAKAEKRLAEKLEAERRKEEEERQRAAKWKEIMIEQEKVDDLIEESEDWAKSHRLRDYIAAKKADYIARGVSIDPASEAGKWLKWASDQADRLDPLAKSTPSILDEEDE